MLPRNSKQNSNPLATSYIEIMALTRKLEDHENQGQEHAGGSNVTEEIGALYSAYFASRRSFSSLMEKASLP